MPRDILRDWDGVAHVGAAACLVATRANLPPGPWSIAELGLSDADFQKLVGWVETRVDPIALEQALTTRADERELLSEGDLRTYKKRDVAGLVLTTLFAEAVGRNGNADAPWQAAASVVTTRPDLLHLLFQFAGGRANPSRALKDAMAAAVPEFDLRWVEDGAMDWFNLLRVQAGLPVDCLPHLPAYLTNDDTLYIRALRDSSASFAGGWDALAGYRRGEVSRDRALVAVEACPLFRGAPAAIVDAARAPLPARQAGPRTVVLNAPELLSEAALLSASLKLSASLRFVWENGSAPCAELEVRVADSLLEFRVGTLLDGQPAVRFRRNSLNDCFRPLESPVLRRPIAPSWTLTVRADHEVTPFVLELFANDDTNDAEVDDGLGALVCFDAHGMRCEPEAARVAFVAVETTEALRVDEPVVVDGIARVCWFDEAGIAIAAVGPHTKLYSAEGEPLWPLTARIPRVDDAKLSLKLIKIVPGEAPRQIALSIAHAFGCSVEQAFLGTARLDVEGGENGQHVWLRGTIPVDGLTPLVRVKLLGEVEGRRFQRTLHERVITAAALGKDFVEPGHTVDARSLREVGLSVALGPEFKGHDAHLTAGDVRQPVDGTHRARRFMLTAPGFGEPLVLEAADSWRGSPRTVIAASIERRGIAKGHKVQGTRLTLELAEPLEPGPGHAVLVWPREGAPRVLKLEVGPAADAGETSSLEVELGGLGGVRAVALCYQQGVAAGATVLGASWSEDWAVDLDEHLDEQSRAIAIEVVRLLHLPVLAERHRTEFVAALARMGEGRALACLVRRWAPDGVTFVGVGADASALVFGTPYCEDSKHWLRVARELALDLWISKKEDPKAFSTAVEKDGRVPARPNVGGVAASAEVLADVARWRNAHGYELVDALLRAGVYPPGDYAAFERVDQFREVFRQRVLHALLQVGTAFVNAPERIRNRTINNHTDFLRRQSGLFPEAQEALKQIFKNASVERVAGLPGRLAPSPQRAILVDGRLQRFLQLELYLKPLVRTVHDDPTRRP